MTDRRFTIVSLRYMPTASPFGSWESPITPEEVTRTLLRFADVVRADDGNVYWVESRPHEGGRSVIVRRSASGAIDDIGPDDFDARTRVHEYGGGAYLITDDTVYASRFDDQRLYRIDAEGEPMAITPDPPAPAALRYADLDPSGDWAVGVREDHTADGEPRNELVRIDLTGGSDPIVLATGADFYAAPRLSPDAATLAWLEWDHPSMPWDGTRLCTAPVDASGLGAASVVAGGPAESIVQPEWSPDGILHWVSDRTGWWNLYRDGDPVLPLEAEFGGPQWVFGMRRYAFLDDGSVVATPSLRDGDRLVVIRDDEPHWIDLPFPTLGTSMAMLGGSVILYASGPDTATSVIRVDLDTGEWKPLRSAEASIDPTYVSVPELITFDTPDGPAHAYFYPPQNPDFTGPEGEAPPLIVQIHGGPTTRARRTLRPDYLFWTSRGFGIVDVDYGGSSGYGREYRERLNGQWGVVDVRDCALAAAHMASLGRADPDRLIITGGSAGGYTTLLALATTDRFTAGASYFGISDLTPLAEHTHKFESRYLDSMVGPLPEAADVYRERSALSHLHTFDTPVLILQGLEDRVVTPDQAETMRDALVERGVPVACIMFEGEGHGFRDAANQIRALEAELSFYGQILGFEPADDIEPVEIVRSP
jgi:dipeptidyl aminopeptidase/acylaminoacyl peptidase